MPTTTNYSWALPTVGGDADAWGSIVNTAFTDADVDLKAVSTAQAADATAITSLGTRVTTLEAYTPAGVAGWASGKFFFGATCEGLEEEVVELVPGRRYLVPFLHQGTFDAFCFHFSAGPSTVTCEVLDSTASGAPGTALSTATSLLSTGGLKTVSLSPSITLRRPAWLAMSFNATADVYSRGTTGGTPRWTLGSASLSPTAATDVVVNVYGTSVPYISGGTSLGTKGWAPMMALRSA